MSDTGEIIRAWWLEKLRPEHHRQIGEDTAAARALRARLRRPSAPSEVLAERAVQDLVRRLPWLRTRPGELIQLVRTLAAVEGEQPAGGGPRQRLAMRLGEAEEGSDRPVMSDLRFQRLIRSEGGDFGTALRRALPLAGKTCDVAQLGRDILAWSDPDRGETTRNAWCFDYFGAARPRPETGPQDGSAGEETQGDEIA